MLIKQDQVSDNGLIRGQISDLDVEMMRKRIGFPNPTLRKGVISKPWNTVATSDAIRRWAECIGDLNPLYCDEDYAAQSRWGIPIAPPGFEWSMGIDRAPVVPAALNRDTHRALRGVQLFHSGAEHRYYRPITSGVRLYKSETVADVQMKQSKFANKSVLVDNATCWWDDQDRVAVTSSRWFVHAERRAVPKVVGEGQVDKLPNDPLAYYSDEQLADIESAYDREFMRGGDTLFLEDVAAGQPLPRMVKGPLTITDMINLHMGGGWFTYGNPPYRLAYENRKRLKGFYSRNEFNAWDTIQRVHWDAGLAHSVGVKHTYDIGPMRFVMACHFLTNFAGNDAWIYRIRYELRNFNFVGDTTWIEGVISDARVDEILGPLVELEFKGINQRGQENMTVKATILVASRRHGPVKLPASPPITPHRRID